MSSLLERLQESISTPPLEDVALHIYTRERERHSFAQMKEKLGRERAVAAERQYRGVADLELQKQEALGQANAIVATLGRAQATEWPKGSHGNAVNSSLSPVDLLLDRPTFFQGDYWYAVCKDNEEALNIEAAHLNCDLITLETERPISRNNALVALDEEPSDLKLGIAFPESPCGFLDDWHLGLYPSLETGESA